MTIPSETSMTIDPREVSLYAGHLDALWGVAWSPDGTRSLSGSHDGTARVRGANRGTELLALAGPSLSISAVVWSPDGTRPLTAAKDHNMHAWDMTIGADLPTLGAGGSSMGGVMAWSPDSTRILTSLDDALARIWDASNGQVVRTLSGHTEYLIAVSQSPDGTRVVTAFDDDTARVWDVITGTELLCVGPMALVGRGATIGPDGRPTHVGPIEPMTGLSWSSGSRRIITASDLVEPRVWDAATGEEALSLHGHERCQASVASWSPDGSRIIIDDVPGTTVHIWDAATGEELLSLRGHHQWACALAWNPGSSCVATGSHDDTACVWNTAIGQIQSVLGAGSSVETVSWSPDGTRLSIGAKTGSSRAQDAITGQSRLTADNSTRELSEVVWNPDGTCLATFSYLSPRVFIPDASTGDVVQALTAGEDDVNDIAWSPGSERILTKLGSNRVAIWDAARGERLLILEGHSDMITSVAWSPSGQRALIGSQDGTARIRDAATGEIVHTYIGNWVRDVVWTQGGPCVVTSSADGAAHVWDVTTSGGSVMLCDDAATACSHVWNPDGTKVLAGFDDGVIRVWDEVSGKAVPPLVGHRFGITDAWWSPNGTRTLVGFEDDTAHLWDAATGEMIELFLYFPPDDGVAILDAPSLSLRSGSGEAWDCLGRPEILAGQLARVGVERRQFLNHDPLPEAVAEPSSAEVADEDPTAPEPVREPQVPEEFPAPKDTEPLEASEADPPAESAVAPSVFAAPAQQETEPVLAQSGVDVEQPIASQSSEDAPVRADAAAQASGPSTPAGDPLIEEVPAQVQDPQVEESGSTKVEGSEIPAPAPASEVVDPAATHQARRTVETAHTPAEAAETPEALDAFGQPVASARTEPVAAPTGETLLVQSFPMNQGPVDGEVSVPVVTSPAMVEVPQSLTAPEKEQQSEAQLVLSASGVSQKVDAESSADALVVLALVIGPADNARRARHATATAQTPADAASEHVVDDGAEAVVPVEPELALPTEAIQSSGTTGSAYEPVAIPAVEHAGGEPMVASIGETVAPDQLEFSLTPVDTAGHEGDEVALDLFEGAGGPMSKQAPGVVTPVEATVSPVADTAETVRAADSMDVTNVVDVAEATDVADAVASEVSMPSGAEATSVQTASAPEGKLEDHAVSEAQAEQAPAKCPQGQESPDRPFESVETEAAQTTHVEVTAENQPSAEKEPAEPTEAAELIEPTPMPWGSAGLHQRIYIRVQEFVAVIVCRDVNELTSRCGMAGNDLAGLDEQLAGLSSPALDLTLYPLKQADDYVDGHHCLDLSELEDGGVVINSELWAHDRSCDVRLIAHWNPMGIYPFDFRNVSM